MDNFWDFLKSNVFPQNEILVCQKNFSFFNLTYIVVQICVNHSQQEWCFKIDFKTTSARKKNRKWFADGA